MSARVLLDNALLAVPNYAETAEAAEEIIFRLKHWADVLVHFGDRYVARSSDLEEVLGEFGYFPVIDNLVALIDVVGLSGIYDARDVWKSYNTILNRASVTQDSVGIEVDGLDSCDLTPDPISECSPENLRSYTRLALATAAIARESLGVSSFFSSSFPSSGEIRINATITSIRGRGRTHCQPLPRMISSSVHMLENIEQIAHYQCADQLWEASEDAADIYFSIVAKCVEIKVSGGEPLEFRSAPHFVIGSEFVRSLKQHAAGPGGTYGGVVLDGCARVLIGAPKQELKPFEKPNRSSDGAAPLRTHLTKGKLALRLMVWRRPDEILELANVGPKWEEKISEGVGAGSFRIP